MSTPGVVERLVGLPRRPGGGGSLGFADPDARVGYTYAMNRLGFHKPVDPRGQAIRHTSLTCIGGPPQYP